MKVILLQDLYKHGVAGQVVEVADGFARNYLIPRGMAEKATRGNLKSHAKLLEHVEARRAAYENKLNELGRQIDGVQLIFGRLAAPTGKLFGSVTTQEIADALLEKTGVDINRRRISQQSLREVGQFEVAVRLGTDVSPILKITIVPENELAEYLAALEAGDEEVMEEILETVDDEETVAVDEVIEEPLAEVEEVVAETLEDIEA